MDHYFRHSIPLSLINGKASQPKPVTPQPVAEVNNKEFDQAVMNVFLKYMQNKREESPKK